jgi:hypothetical protein
MQNIGGDGAASAAQRSGLSLVNIPSQKQHQSYGLGRTFYRIRVNYIVGPTQCTDMHLKIIRE